MNGTSENGATNFFHSFDSCALGVDLTQTVLGFDCGTNEVLLEVGAGLENKNAKEEPTIPTAKLNELIQKHFKDFKYKLPGEGSAFGWNHIDVKS